MELDAQGASGADGAYKVQLARVCVDAALRRAVERAR
jgi:hypothetical protein